MSGRIFLSFVAALASSAAISAFTIPGAVAATHPKATPQVVMYSTKTCPYCVKARDWFSSRGIRWDERDIESSDVAHKEWESLGGVGTPLILINGKPYNGFSESTIATALERGTDQ